MTETSIHPEAIAELQARLDAIPTWYHDGYPVAHREITRLLASEEVMDIAEARDWLNQIEAEVVQEIDEIWIDEFIRIPAWFWEHDAAMHDRTLLLLASDELADRIAASERIERIHERIEDWATD